jgi:PPOX class probable F420-dependent enzyme
MAEEPLDPHVVELAQGKTFATVVTLMPDGRPQAQVTWIDTDGTHLLVNTERDRQRTRNVRRDPRVTVSLVAPGNPYDTAEVRGRVVEVVEDEAARAHIDELSQRYTGGPYQNPIGSPRVILKIAAEKQIIRG